MNQRAFNRVSRLKTAILMIFFILAPCFFGPAFGPSIWANNENKTAGDSLRADTEEHENQTTSHLPGIIPSLDRVLSYYDVIHHALKYRLMELQSLKEADPPPPDFDPSTFSRYLRGISCFEDGRAMTFDIIQSKLKRKEIFLSFHLTLHPRDHRVFLEIALTPSSEADVNFWIPFLSER